MIRPGKFITLEGPEGCGKSTQTRALVDRLTAANCPFLAVREPGGTALGESIRGILQRGVGTEPMCSESELFLFMASRAQLVRQVIKPALEQGRNIICDRFADSTTAYQGYARGMDLNSVLAINDFAVCGVKPDLTILLDLDVTIGFERLRQRNVDQNSQHDRIEREAITFHEKVRNGYLDLARRWPERFRVVDASKPPTEVQETVWRLVKDVIDG